MQKGVMGNRALTACRAALALLGLACSQLAHGQIGGQDSGQASMGGGGLAPAVDCLDALERQAAEHAIARYRFGSGQELRSSSGVPEKFTFYPMGGTLYRDLFTVNFVDLDPTSAILDWDCSDFSYNGHDATDVDLRSFGEQTIGVPVFAALDGTVVSAHDGEDDMHTSCAGIANSVILDHGNGRFCYYWHFKKNSVQVVAGQVVKAGQQIGLVGSSGCSTGPHLHFATYDDGNLVEPYAGPCRPGASEWVAQTPIERSLYVRDLNVTNADISSYPGLPFDMPRRGTFVQGTRPVRFWIMLGNLPAASTWRVRYLRPNATVALNTGTQSFSNPFYRWSWWWWSYNLNLNQIGTWQIELFLNGSEAARAPFDVVASAGEVVNRAPNPIGVSLEPLDPSQHDVLLCRVDTDLVLDDRDYDIVRYRYQWVVDGVTLRDVTTAAHSDAFPRRTAPPGSLVTCTVTPSDGIDAGAAVPSTVQIRWGRSIWRAAEPVSSTTVQFP